MDDFELWRAWAAGDEDAGNLLVRKHFTSIYRFFRSKVGDLADELTQRTFLACVEQRTAYRGQGSVKAYIFGIARRQLLRHFEGRGRGLDADELANSAVADLDPSPSRLIAQQQDHVMLLEAMRRVPLDHQIVIELFYWEELPIADIATVLDVAKGTVKSRLSRAKDNLREQLHKLEAGDLADAFEEHTGSLGVALGRPADSKS